MIAGAVILAVRAAERQQAVGAGAGWDPGSPLTVVNRPVVTHAIQSLVEAGIERISVVCSSGGARAFAEADTTTGGRVEYMEVPGETSDLVALLVAAERMPAGPLVVHADDSLVVEGLVEILERFDAAQPDALVVTDVVAGVSAPGAGPPRTVVLEERRLGVQVLSPEALGVAAELERTSASLDALPEALGSRELSVEPVRASLGWRFRGTADSLLELSEALLNRLPDERPAAVVPGVRFAGRVQVHPTARVRRSKLRGPVVIGAHARVEDAYVGPYTSIGDGAIVANCEVERTVVQAGAAVHSVELRIEDSIIGARARVTRTFTRPSALRIELGPYARVSMG